MNTIYPITVYYDASCRLCNGEMQNVKAHDIDNKLNLIDCSVPEFDESEFSSMGITRQHMMNRMHIKDAKGNWHIGVAAFEVIYQAVGMDFVAKIWGSSFTRPLAERVYPWVVKHRYILSKIRLPELFGFLEKRAARKAERRSRLCSEDRCSTERK